MFIVACHNDASCQLSVFVHTRCFIFNIFIVMSHRQSLDTRVPHPIRSPADRDSGGGKEQSTTAVQRKARRESDTSAGV